MRHNQRSSVHGDSHETTTKRIGCLSLRECVAIWNYKDTKNTDTSQSLSWCVQHMTSVICRAMYNSVERNTERTADFTNSQCECSSRVALATVGRSHGSSFCKVSFTSPWFLSQGEPHCLRFFTCVTTPFVVQSTASTNDWSTFS